MKFFNHFGSGAIHITQTYHTGNNNRAVDMVGDFILNPWAKVYAVADGKPSMITGILGGYLALDLDNSNLRVLYVHGDRWVVKVGQQVKRGQHIGYVKLFSPKHLHLGLQYKRGAGYPNLMDYMDRSLTYKTKYPSIRAIWWKDGKINWNLFKDRSYLKETPQYKRGQKLVFTDTMEYRNQKGIDIGDVAKGAVCKLISNAVWGTIAGYSGWWYDADFLDIKGGQIADTSRNKLTDAQVSRIDSTIPKPPDPCTEYKKTITELEQKLRALQRKFDSAIVEQVEVLLENTDLVAENNRLVKGEELLVRLSNDLEDLLQYTLE